MKNKWFWWMVFINLILLFLLFFFWFSNKTKDIVSENKYVYINNLEQNIKNTASTYMKSVVQIVAEDESMYYQEWSKDLLEKDSILYKWSWIIASKKWYILTNTHVIDNPDLRYTVIINGESFPVKKIWKDDFVDLAILLIDINAIDLQEANFISFRDNVSIWEFVLAIWNALSEYINTTSFGIISWKWRSLHVDTDIHYWGLYQTDAAINPWNSWGPLINLSWEVIGVVTAISRWWNDIWFALPISKEFVEASLISLEQYQLLIRPYLWISYTDTNSGTIIDTIYSWSPVQWQLKNWDIILAIDNNDISLSKPLLYYLYWYNSWDIVVFTLLRNNQKKNIQITLGQKTI